MARQEDGRAGSRSLLRETACAAALFIYSCHAYALTDTPVEASRLGELSLEELANIQVTSVSKRPQRLSDAAASVFVITAEDIRRSGLTSLPDVLRLAPNLQVAQVHNGQYSITARGLNGSANSLPNKLLVLIDGRSVYSPFFAGVFWDVQNVMLEDVDRIEVISGPGGTLWGINAVNGVINIVTRSASATQGNLVSVEGGNRGSDAAFRHGGTFGDGDGSYRVYGQHIERNATSLENGAAVNDALHMTQLGFRADWSRGGDRYSVEGNTYSGTTDQPIPGVIQVSGVALPLGLIPLSGTNIRANWDHLLDDGSHLNFQGYFDRTRRTVPPTFSESLDVADFQLQHSLRPLGMHMLVWGGSARFGSDQVGNSPFVAFLPADRKQRWTSLFAQDEMALRDDLRLTVGARLEHNDYTGREFLPNIRLSWKPDSTRLVWGALSRTVRAPTRLDRDAFIPGAPPFLLAGGPAVTSEVAKVMEVGYRAQASERISYSVTVFHNVYTDLRTQEISPDGSSAIFSSRMDGHATGLESWGSWQALRNWRLSAGMTALREKFSLQPGANDPLSPLLSALDPSYTLLLRSSYDFSKRGELDLTLRHVAKLGVVDVPAYTALDLRYGWKLKPGVELSVAAQNLLGAGHVEFSASPLRSAFDRSLWVKLVAGF